jgi:hypothetical protein
VVAYSGPQQLQQQGTLPCGPISISIETPVSVVNPINVSTPVEVRGGSGARSAAGWVAAHRGPALPRARL